MQPEPRRGVHVGRTVDAPRPRKPQRHDGRQPDRPRRLAVEAGRRDPHRPHATGLRPQAVGGVCFVGRCEYDARRAALPREAARAGRGRRRIQRAGGHTSRRRSRIAAGRPSSWRPARKRKSGVSKMGRAAAKLCRLAFELAKAARRGCDGRIWPWPAWPKGRRPTPAPLLLAAAERARQRRAAKTWRSSPRGVPRSTATIACRTSWPRR